MSPSEIESVILELPDVLEVSVKGVPHHKYGEVPRAYIVTKANMDTAMVRLLAEKVGITRHKTLET